MSTRSRINVKVKSDIVEMLDENFMLNAKAGDYVSIYCHFDGYTKHVGSKLLTYYNDYETALSLIFNGDISCFENDGSVDSYAARGEDLHIAKTSSPTTEEYTYLFDDDKWLVYDYKSDMFIPLTWELIDKDF